MRKASTKLRISLACLKCIQRSEMQVRCGVPLRFASGTGDWAILTDSTPATAESKLYSGRHSYRPHLPDSLCMQRHPRTAPALFALLIGLSVCGPNASTRTSASSWETAKIDICILPPLTVTTQDSADVHRKGCDSDATCLEIAHRSYV